MVPGQPVWAQGAPEESGGPSTELSLVGATLRVALMRAAGLMAPGWPAFLMWPVGGFPGLVRLGRPGCERHSQCSALDWSCSPALVPGCMPRSVEQFNVRPVALASVGRNESVSI